jgi:hypothetical protein
VVLVTEPTPFGLSDLMQSVDTLRGMGKSCGVIINRADLGNKDIYDYLKFENIPLLMTVPFDKRIAVSYSNGELLTNLDPYWEERLKYFYQNLSYNKIMLIGDSNTDNWRSTNLLPDSVVNRGIAGDDSRGLLERVNLIYKEKPSKIFIMIGTNDLLNNIQSQTINNLEGLILNLKTFNPKIYLISILPINDIDFIITNKHISNIKINKCMVI